MNRRMPPTHLGQLYAAVATFAIMTLLAARAAVGIDGPDRASWALLFGGVLTVWAFAAIWLLIAFALTIRATWRAWRTPVAHRPAPGIGRAISWTDREFEAMAEAWLTEEPADVPPVDPLAAERPRPEQPRRRPRHGMAEDIAEAAWAASEEAPVAA